MIVVKEINAVVVVVVVVVVALKVVCTNCRRDGLFDIRFTFGRLMRLHSQTVCVT
jgi:hypothetical protein